jgi:hypothetical protein
VRRQFPAFIAFWPVAGIGIAVIVNLGWLGFLGVEFIKLIEAAFF